MSADEEPIDIMDHIIGSRLFSSDDQETFASQSGDRNPLHMDSALARRLMTGRRVVHGIHVLLCALEHYLVARPHTSPGRISCTFSSPVSVGDRVDFVDVSEPAGPVAIEARVGGLRCLTLFLSIGTKSPAYEAEPEPADSTDDAVTDDSTGELASPLEISPDDHVGKVYALAVGENASLAERFPVSCEIIGARAVTSLVRLSYFVGMVCPGMHSIFSALTIGVRDDTAIDQLRISVRRFDRRVGLFQMSVGGPLHGEVRAFLRPQPRTQPKANDVASVVRPQEFAGTTSLVVGGSRGLGEVCAKLIAGGGGTVILTYASGSDDAHRVCDEINAINPGKAACVHWDVTARPAQSLEIDWPTVHSAFYFATPRIFRRRSRLFDRSIFNDFCLFYLEAFSDLCDQLDSQPGQAVCKVFLPSSVAVTERPRDMTEYAMSKAAAEVLAEDINRSSHRVKILPARLPRLDTDQTTSVMALPSESNVAVMLPIVREMIARAGTDAV